MASSAPQTTAEVAPEQPVTQTQQDDDEETNELEVDRSDADSAFGGSAAPTETTSLASVYKGYYENGRRYQNVRSKEYFMPTDDKQWESMGAGHMVMLILDSQRSNTLFRSPVSPKWQHIVDLGTGSGEWAIDVADRYPSITVRAVDLYPPPQPWTAPNCFYEVDDITQPWTWSNKFDLAHIRHLLGALSVSDWNALYKRIYDNLEPGGWIEQVEGGIGICCDDDSLPKDSMLATQWRDLFIPVAEKADRPLDVYEKMRGRIEEAGFINVRQQDYKMPIGTWPSLQVYKDAGRASKQQFTAGMEGWVMWLLTNHGTPAPWTVDEVQVYLAKIRNELDQGWHIYQAARRVWAQKPHEPQPERSEPVVENVATQPETMQKTAQKSAGEGV